MIKNKKVLLGVCGSIAVYKALLLVRLLVKNGNQVKVIMTDDAREFVQPLSFATLSKNRVYSSFYNEQGAEWNNHVELGLWADYFVIAPATASTISKMANGHSNNILVATYLSARCPVAVAPAMDLDMWKHPSTLRNIAQLESDGVQLIDVGDGELASGLSGKGRMAEPEDIFSFLGGMAGEKATSMAGKKVLVSAGPTYQPIDPVRFIGNHSSGKMGIAIAEAAAARGADVTLVLGPTHLTAKNEAVKTIKIFTAQDMLEAVQSEIDTVDVLVMAAAVADYTPTETSTKKIKKKEGDMSIPLKRTADILKAVGSNKQAHQIFVGFALETNNELENAKGKLKRKNLDLIVLNSMKDKGAGFKSDTNKVTFIDRNNNIEEFQLKSKSAVAEDILNKAIELTNA